jgi:preprotein translocase subunit YajC
MDFLINNAWAQDAPATSTGGIAQFLPLIILFVVFYLFLIRPQMKRQKDQKNMVEALAKGDEIATNGGLLGKITDLGENFIVIEVAKDVQVKVQRHAVSATMPEGTIKTL